VTWFGHEKRRKKTNCERSTGYSSNLLRWQWVRALKLAHPEQNATLLELILEVDHQGQRIARFDAAIDQAVDAAPERYGRSSTDCKRCVGLRK